MASINDLRNNLKNSELYKNFSNSIGDRLKNKSLEKKETNNNVDISFNKKNVSLQNRHKDVISDILSSTFNGDLFKAGMLSLNALNYGTKWENIEYQHTSKNLYWFRYGNNISDINNSILKLKNQEETKEKSKLKSFLNNIEDPTILGFSLSIDFQNSALFADKYVSIPGEPIIPSIKNTETDNKIKNQPTKIDAQNSRCCEYFCDLMFTEKKDKLYERSVNYLKDFKEYTKILFSNPEYLSDYYSTTKKNHYIYNITGLNKLEKHFVDEEDYIELDIIDDVRLFISQYISLYKDLTWSKKAGKHLIPKNLLYFNLYIKIADIRDYTSGISEIKNRVREGYSRFIYELKDCEFIFEDIINDSISMGGIESNPNSIYNSCKVKIKYRSVSKIFYSQLYDDTSKPRIIENKKLYFKDWSKDTSNILPDPLNYELNYNFSNDNYLPLHKRAETSNNIPVLPSVSSRLTSLRDNGIFKPNEEDNSIKKFTKSLGNQVIKAGGNLISDKIDSVYKEVNSNIKKSDIFNNKITDNIKNLLDNKIPGKREKGKELGDNIVNTSNINDYTSNYKIVENRSKGDTNIEKIKMYDLTDDKEVIVEKPNEFLSNNIIEKNKLETININNIDNNVISIPNIDLAGDEKIDINLKETNINIYTDIKIISPKENLHNHNESL